MFTTIHTSPLWVYVYTLYNINIEMLSIVYLVNVYGYDQTCQNWFPYGNMYSTFEQYIVSELPLNTNKQWLMLF